MRKVRVLIAKIGLDYHDRGAKLLCRALRDAGVEVIYTGLFQSPEAVVRTARDEDVDVIGISTLSGSHMALVPKIMSLLEREGLQIPVLAGGIVPDKDAEQLKEIGVREVFGPGTHFAEVVNFINDMARVGDEATN